MKNKGVNETAGNTHNDCYEDSSDEDDGIGEILLLEDGDHPPLSAAAQDEYLAKIVTFFCLYNEKTSGPESRPSNGVIREEEEQLPTYDVNIREDVPPSYEH